MAAKTMARRLAAARKALRTASSAAECLPALTTMIEVAAESRKADGEGADQARSLLDETIGRLRVLEAELPGDDDAQLFALRLRAEACLLRDDSAASPLPDLDDAVACLRRLQPALADRTEDRAEVDLRLGGALLTRCGRPRGSLGELDEAGALLASALGQMPPDDPRRGPVGSVLAIQRALRYVAFGGTGADRDAALSYAAMCLAASSDGAEADDVACAAHVVIAWMTLARQFTAEQRSAMMMTPAVEEARRDSEAAASLLKRLEDFGIARGDAETAITHLRLVPAAIGNEALRGVVPMLWAMALFATVRADGAASAELAGDARRVADELSHAAAGAETETLERGELLALRGLVLAAEAGAFDGKGGEPSAMDSLTDAATGLPVGHLLRSPIGDVLGQLLGHQVSEAVSADDAGARLEEIADTVERLPRGDPGFGRALVSAGMRILNVSATSRSMSQREPLVSLFDRLVPKLAPDDPLLPLAQHMRCLARCLQGVQRHRPELVDAAIEEMTRYAGLVPLLYPFRPFMLYGVATAYVERHAMGGEIRHLERAAHFIDRALAEADPGGPFAEGSPLYGMLLFTRGHIRAIRGYYDPTPDLVTAAITDLERAGALVSQDLEIPSLLASSLDTARMMRERIAAPPARSMSLNSEERGALDRILEAAERTSPDRIEYPIVLAQASSGLVLRGLADHDIKLIDRAISMLGEACSGYGLAIGERALLLELLGQALLTRHSLTRVPSDLSNA
ncbi:MAG: hypothetical protein ACRDNF_03880, partial [Streptosporangiaceae bacterium]